VEAGEIVVDSPFLHWHDVPLRSLLSQQLDAPVHLDNDVVGLTKAQHWFGHGKGYASFALLTVGAGIGFGLVVNNDMVPTRVAPDQPLSRGRIRAAVSARAIEGA
jgi:predicted NBD/HSP70 family sugar kinase